MNTKKFNAVIPQTRVTKKTERGLLAICEAQEMSMADVVRAALEEYLQPAPKRVAVPIAGTITPVNGEYIILPESLLGGERREASPRPIMAGQYLEAETVPPAARSIAKNGPSVTKGS